MPTTVADLRQERAKLIADARKLVDTAEGEKRDLTNEENEQFDKHMAAAELLEERYTKLEKLETAEHSLTIPGERRTRPETPVGSGKMETATDAEPENRVNPRATKEYRKAFETWTRFGPESNEYRALQAGVDTSGGYTYPDEEFVNKLIKFIDDAVHIRRLASKATVSNADSLGYPTLDTDPADATWTSELGTGSEDSSMAFGKRALTPHPLAKRIKVSNTLLERSLMSNDTLVIERLGNKFAKTQEAAFMTGTGSQQPLGVFTASASGINTTRDVSTGNTTTAIGADGLIEAQYTLKPGYWPKAEWIFHRDAIKMLRKLKDGDGQYIWQAGLQAGQPDRLLNLPFNMSEDAPNTFTTGLYVGILGDFSYYYIADAMTLRFQRLAELYAETNQTGFIGRLECDGMPVLEEAFVRVTLA